jgi:hypothetical protein
MMLPRQLPATNAKRLRKGATGSRECAPLDERNCARAVMTGSAICGGHHPGCRFRLRSLSYGGQVAHPGYAGPDIFCRRCRASSALCSGTNK